MNNYQELYKFYHSLCPHDSAFLEFHNLSLRELDYNGRLERIFFGIACVLADICESSGNSFIIMVTASHNPPGYNGIKIEPFMVAKINETDISQIINDEKKTLHILQRLCSRNNKIEGKNTFYLGRDKRITSLRLAGIIKNTLHGLGKRVIDLGQRTTPQVFSLSQFINNYEQKDNIEQIVKEYYQTVKKSFAQAIKQISNNSNRKWQKKSICMDFANGVGGKSFKNYQFLQEYFQILPVNFQRFDIPNVQCGAQWIYQQFKKTSHVPNLNHYPKASEYYFFDGDSDRIIGKMGQSNRIMDGDDFSACFVRLIRHLFVSMDLKEQSIGSVVNILSNDSLGKYLSTLNVNIQKAAVGVREAFAAIKKYDVGCYFELCGHGSLYFSEKMRRLLSELQQKYWQAKLLLCLDGLSRNNSRGYALHDMLIMQIYLFYFEGECPYLFEKSYILSKQYTLQNPLIFHNSNEGKKLLEKPSQLLNITKKLQQEFEGESIMLRKSTTTPIVKISIQGKKQNCLAILQRFQYEFKQFVNAK